MEKVGKMTLVLCPNMVCNKPIDWDDKHCGYCGCRVKPILCKACDTPKKNKGHLYCTKCGKSYTYTKNTFKLLTAMEQRLLDLTLIDKSDYLFFYKK